jgi:threonine synthase
MMFFSTHNRSNRTSFKEAVIKSLPSDGGLFFPELIPIFNKSFLEQVPSLDLKEIGFEVMRPYCQNDIPDEKLHSIIEETFCFDIPIKKVDDQIYSLELFHGPTYAFKDVGARFLARCLSYFQEGENNEVTILVATSGDTGGAVADGFYDIPGVNVVVLYPSGKVSPLQELQISSLGKNITALEVSGDFDDCQRMVKEAFLDKDINAIKNISSANSINIARWLPQSIYYFVPFQKWGMDCNPLISVPSGNYGNITAGILSKKSGLPIRQFIAASNVNDVVPRYLKSGNFDPKPTRATISNAMDVSLPSNFVRLQELYSSNHSEVVHDILGFSLGDKETSEVIKRCFQDHNYLIDPHSAVSYAGLSENLGENEKGIFLSTAHYCKFKEVVDSALGAEIEMPTFTEPLFKRKKKSIQIRNQFADLKEFLIGS